MRWNITVCRNSSRNSSITLCSSTCTIRVTIMPISGSRGDVVVADNFSLLHGREGFTARSARHLQRVHIQSNPVCANLALKPANAEA